VTEFQQLNLHDLENFAERFGLAPDRDIRFGRSALGIEGGGFSYQKFAPNLPGSAGHRHRTQEEVYVVIAGSGQAKLDDEVRELRQWDVLRVLPPVARGFASGPDGLELLAIGFGEGGDGEIIEGFWDDAG
jgi:mannose-6-phosphate isomerase-like protein (cupin superfamily)